MPTTIFNPSGLHVIVGGTGGLGRSMVKYMVEHGARHILLVSRSGGDGGTLGQLRSDMEGFHNAMITVIQCDVCDKDQVEALVECCTSYFRPICGVIHAAMVLRVSLGSLVWTVPWRKGELTRPHDRMCSSKTCRSKSTSR